MSTLLEAPQQGASNEYPQHMFSWRNKKDISIFSMKKAPYLLLCVLYHSAVFIFIFLGISEIMLASWKWSSI